MATISAPFLALQPYPVIAYEEPEEKSPEDIPGKVSYWAKRYGVDDALAHHIAKNESKYRADAIGDMNIICRRTGGPVRARGVFQITECFHPNVSDAAAFDPDQNIEYAMQLILLNCRQQFSTCRTFPGTYLK